jgi:hypothetical protein
MDRMNIMGLFNARIDAKLLGTSTSVNRRRNVRFWKRYKTVVILDIDYGWHLDPNRWFLLAAIFLGLCCF